MKTALEIAKDFPMKMLRLAYTDNAYRNEEVEILCDALMEAEALIIIAEGTGSFDTAIPVIDRMRSWIAKHSEKK